MLKSRILVLMLLFVIVFGTLSGTSVFAAPRSHIDLIFDKVREDPAFMPKLYVAAAAYADRGYNNDTIDARIKLLIADTLNQAVLLRKSGEITAENYDAKLKAMSDNMTGMVEPLLLAVFLDAFLDFTNLRSAFGSLVKVIYAETKSILFTDELLNDIGYKFIDVEAFDWAKDAIFGLAEKEIINGVDDTHFAPTERVTREQFVKMLCIAFNIDISSPKTRFRDVNENAWFYPYAAAMADAGLVLGVGDGKFGTGDYITREDMAVLMFRIARNEELNEGLGVRAEDLGDSEAFVDYADIAGYAAEAVGVFRELKIINGTPENYFYPKNSAVRAEAAQMLYKFTRYALNS